MTSVNTVGTEPQSRMSLTPQTLHRIAAGLEMVTWTLLILGMVLKYTGVTETLVPIAGTIHGFGSCVSWR